MGGSAIAEVISLSQWLWSDGSWKDQTLGRGELQRRKQPGEELKAKSR